MSDEFLTLSGPSLEETATAPTRWAAPLAALGGVLPEVDTLLTVGDPAAGWWLVDHHMLASARIHVQGGREMVELISQAEWGAAAVRGAGGCDVSPGEVVLHTVFAPLDEVWLYRDGASSEVSEFDSFGWFSRVRDDASVPPARLDPRPARELPSLSGRVARWCSPRDGWQWVRMMGEAVNGDEISVPVCAVSRFWRFAFNLTPPPVSRIPLHRLWVY